MNDAYQDFIDEMTDIEYRIFSYHFFFKISQKRIAKRLRISTCEVNQKLKELKKEASYVNLKQDIQEAFLFLTEN